MNHPTFMEEFRRIDRIAEGMLGIRYLPGGRDPKEGLDCWGVVMEFHRRWIGVDLSPHDPLSVDAATCEASPIMTRFCKVAPGKESPGDVARFHVRPDSPSGHLGILLPKRRVLHPYLVAGVISSPARGLIDSYYRYIEGGEG